MVSVFCSFKYVNFFFRKIFVNRYGLILKNLSVRSYTKFLSTCNSLLSVDMDL